MTRWHLRVTMASYCRDMASKTALSIVATQTTDSRPPFSVTAAHCIGFFLLLTVGALGLSAEQAGPSEHAVELRKLFALLLSAALLLRTLWVFRQSGRTLPGVLYAFHVRSARMIYLLLYCLIGFQLIVDLRGNGQVNTEPCQFYVECGVLALVAFRALIKPPLEIAPHSLGPGDGIT